MDDHKKKHEFSDFFENFSGSNGRNRREIQAVIDSFETYTTNSLMKNKTFETNFIMSRALFWVAPPKQKKLKWFFSRFRCNGNIPCAQILFQSFFPTFQIFFINIFLSKFFALSLKKLCFHEKKFMKLVSESSE